MPVTIKPSKHGANLAKDVNASGMTRSPHDVLSEILAVNVGGYSRDPFELFQSSLDPENDQMPTRGVRACSHGFLAACMRAYSNHHHLSIRPEDIWFAILSQFSAYVNAHGEELRHHFVSHQGQKELVLVYDHADRYSFDFGIFAKDMSQELKKNVNDPWLHKWILPDFTTTTRDDVVVASITMMSTLQTYFRYTCELCCGIPSVTLLGEKTDYESILRRLDKFEQFGNEPARFASLLRPIVSRFVACFDNPESPDVIDFWQRIYKHIPNFSGDDQISGWIAAFCFWNNEGRCLSWLPADYEVKRHGQVVLDGVVFPYVSQPQIPNGWCKAPVKLIDNGKVIESWMLSGSVALHYNSSGLDTTKDDEGNAAVGLDSVQPRTAWFMFTGGFQSPVKKGS